MLRLKVTADLLNIRNTPAVSPVEKNYLGELPLGALFNAESLVRGEVYELSDLWFRDQYNRYYWAGGVEVTGTQEIAEADTLQFPAVPINWRDNFKGIPDTYKTYTGQNVKVAVIDSGLEMAHPAFAGKFAQPVDYTAAGDFRDTYGHGTSVAGIICGGMVNGQGISGVAPGARVVPIRVMKDEDNKPNLSENVTKAIYHAIDTGCDIINISADLSFAQGAALTKALEAARDQQIMIVAAAGDNDSVLQGILYPARLDYAISVGSANTGSIARVLARPQKRLDIIAPDLHFISCSTLDKHGYEDVFGCSFACAFISGLTAVILSWYKATSPDAGRLPRDKVLQYLKTCSQAYSPAFFEKDHFSFISFI